jgi:hypothetical protein
MSRKETNQSIVKRDIDTLLPSVRTYEESIDRLREIGYTVNDRKGNGDWLAHISFQAPLQDKATRDYKLGDGEYYTRENLTVYIEGQTKTRDSQTRSDDITSEQPVNVPYFESYEYGVTDISKINSNWRSRGASYIAEIVPRAENEKKIIADIYKTNNEVSGLIDTTELIELLPDRNGQGARISRIRRKEKRNY